jgi:Ca2+:H+ antiporter
LLLGNPLTLELDQFELVALGAAALIASSAARDGESNWLEGAQLLVVYVIIGLAFFFLPM